MCLQASKNIWTYRHTRAKQLQHFKEPDWVPITINFQHVSISIVSPPLLPIIFCLAFPLYFSNLALWWMGLRKQRGGQKKPFFSHITFQMDQFPPLHGHTDFTIGCSELCRAGNNKPDKRRWLNPITGCEHEAWGKPLLFQSQWLLVCHLCPWQCSFPRHHRLLASYVVLWLNIISPWGGWNCTEWAELL